jgi:hypothetical protein
VVRVNVKKAAWEVILKDKGPRHFEFDHLVYDAKRDRILHFGRKDGRGRKQPEINAFSFKTKTWERIKTAGAQPPGYYGGGCYVPEIDAACLPVGKTLYFLKLADLTWDRMKPALPHGNGGNGRDIHYDPELKVFLYTGLHKGGIGTFVMRPDFGKLEMKPLNEK